MNIADKARAQAAFGKTPSLMFITQGPTLPDLLDEGEWQMFRAQMQARGFPGFMAAKMKPIWGSMMLGIGPCQARSGALNADGIDMVLASAAQEAGVPDRSLEDWRTVMTLTDAYDMDEQIEMLRLSFAYADRADDLQYTLLQRYLSGEVALIWEYSRLLSLQQGGSDAAQDFARFEDLLLTQRNTAWVDRLLERTRGQTVFIGAGAAHLPGETGLLFQPGDVETLTGHLDRLLSTPELRRRFSVASRSRVQELSWERQAGELEAFYRRAIGE
jgi:uncharacterized protein YbaP (TraB family)